MNYKIKINGTEYEVNIHKFEGTMAHLTVNEVDFEVEIEGLVTKPTRMEHKPVVKTIQQTDVPLLRKPQVSSVSGSGYELRSPLPGVIFEVNVKEGDTVKAGQQVLILEAMKMENSIQAERAGVIEKINCKKGDSVLEGNVLLTIK